VAVAVLFTTQARKQFEKLTPAIRERIATALDRLAATPLAGKPLHGELEGDRSFRVGEWRIVYTADLALHRVVVLRVGHRGEVYR
jgi:mRNA interferase RelE/StbE